MSAVVIGAIGLALLFFLIILHVPIGVSMGLTGFFTIGYLIGFGPAIGLFGAEGREVVSSEGLATVATFILMGAFANLSGLAQDLYRLAYAFLGHMRGGLALATVGACGGFGSVSGSSVATTATMTRIALPEMAERGYSTTLSAGSIAAGGTLGMLIPPSIVMIIYGILTEQFVIALFAAALIPGVLSVIIYFVAIRVLVFFNPDAGPAGPKVPWPERLQILKRSWGVVALAAIVSGGLYTGVFSPAESASVGVSVAFLFALFRGKINWRSFFDTLIEAAATTGMIYVIIIGAHIFSFFMTLSGLPEEIVGSIEASGLSKWTILIMLFLMFLLLGEHLRHHRGDGHYIALRLPADPQPWLRPHLVGRHHGHRDGNRHDYAADRHERVHHAWHGQTHTAHNHIQGHRAVCRSRFSTAGARDHLPRPCALATDGLGLPLARSRPPGG